MCFASLKTWELERFKSVCINDISRTERTFLFLGCGSEPTEMVNGFPMLVARVRTVDTPAILLSFSLLSAILSCIRDAVILSFIFAEEVDSARCFIF